MATDTVISPAIREPKNDSRPILASYDHGYEHSVEHLIELRRKVEEAAKQPVIRKRPPLAKV
jgi:hypothetical protein